MLTTERVLQHRSRSVALSRAAVCLALPLAALAGCEEPGAWTFAIEFDDTVEDPGATQFVEVSTVESCEAVTLGAAPPEELIGRTWLLRRGEPLPALEGIGASSPALYGRAFSSACEVVAAGCVPLTLSPDKTAHVILTLGSASCDGGAERCGTRVCALDDGGGDAPPNAPPSAPGPLVATGGIGHVALAWETATDDVGVEAYRVYRGMEAGFGLDDAALIARVPDTAFMDTPAPGAYFYRVVAEDGEGLTGAPSGEATATALPDEEAPSAPGALMATTGVGTITLTWGAATDNVAVAKYTVHRSTNAGLTPSAGNRVAEVAGLTHVDVAAPGTYYFRVVAEDPSGNRGPASNEVSALSAQAPPSAPGALVATGGIGRVTLTWGPATDDVGIASYHVHRASSAGFTPTVGNRIAMPSDTAFTDVVAPGTYYYRVLPVDLGGLTGPASNEASGASVADTTAPTTPGTLSASGSARRITLSWTASSDNVGVTGYNIYRSSASGFVAGPGNLLAQTTSLNYSDTNLLGTYYYRVAARDSAGNLSSVSNQASATATQQLSYNWAANYATACPFTLHGDATCGTEVRLTTAEGSKRGAAYTKDKITIGADTSFEVSFRLQFDDPHPSGFADGVVFVIRRDTAPPLGHPSGNLGYEASPAGDPIAAPAVAPSVGVEFDTFNGPTDPGTGGHIAVVKGGLNTALASHLASKAYTYSAIQYVYAWVDYDGPTNTLRVYASTLQSKPLDPVITHIIDIPAAIGGPLTYFGFTGATGGYYARQRVGPMSIKTYD